MAFKLSEQLNNVGNQKLPIELYQSYVEHNKHKFPKSVLKVMELESWSGGSASNAPYNSELQRIEILDYGKSTASLKMYLLKQDYVEQPFTIEINYKGLFKLNIPEQDVISEKALKWRYEEILFFDPYHSHKLKDKMFTHNIEWVNGDIWSITAREFEVKWVDT